jgi:three-Cys-motif partner protein
MADEHFFGGDHTETKLSCLRQYLTAYSVALQNKGFARIYVDAFAGTGSRAEVRGALPILGTHENTVVTTEGSAAIAMGIEPAFHHIALIEQDATKAMALKKFVETRGTSKVRIREGDANEIVKHICRRTEWHRPSLGIPNGIRGVIFLDPYGMEVEWSTVEAIAATKALDCWYFFPLAGLYRNAPHDPLGLDQSKIAALNRVLGTQEWRDDWYSRPGVQYDLLGAYEPSERRNVDVDAIEDYVRRRLATIFQGAVLPPLRIKNAGGAPLASLFFAVSNPSGAAVGLASRIAGHILNAGISS